LNRCVIVSGAAGFIGSNLVRHLVSHDYKVVSLDKLTYAGLRDNLSAIGDDALHQFVHGAIEDTGLMAKLLREHRPRAVLNLAAESHVDRSIDSPGNFVDTNIIGVFKLLEVVRGYLSECSQEDQSTFRFLQVSTDEVYGSVTSGAFTEDSPFRPNSPYAASKSSGDCMVRAYHHTYNLPTIISNCSNNYGPYQFPEKLIPLTILKAISGEPLPVYGDGRQKRDWLHVEDHCRALALLVDAGIPGETYNVGGGCCIENLEIDRTVCATLDQLNPSGRGNHADAITHVTDRPGHDRHYEVNHDKITQHLGWQPEVSITDGLEATVHWYLDNGAWLEKVRAQGYSGARLGLAGSQS